MTVPTQAAILCGGLGTRLRPLTDTLPKPLAPVNGRPFLAYLIDQLREQGVSRVLLLTGYLGEMIRDRFGDGARAGVRIDYSCGPVEWETGRRLFEARARLDARFLLLYADNFASIALQRISDVHEARPAAATLVLQPKPTGNIRLAPDGRIELYDPTRAAPGLEYVEIGYMLVERDPALEALPSPDVSFSCALKRLVEQGRVNGIVTRDPYHSASDYERLQLAARYLAPKRLLIIDRDGTINERPPRAQYVRAWENFVFIEDTVKAMQELAADGFTFVVISNQAGIARGMQDAGAVAEINRRMVMALRDRGIDVHSVYVCPHHWDDGCECRKPAPGLFFRASQEHFLRMDRTIYIGDDARDCRAAFNAGCLSVLIGPEWNAVADDAVRPAFAAETLREAVSWITSRFEAWERNLEAVAC